MNRRELLINTPLICPTIVGRATELAALHTIVDEIEAGHSRLVLLSGEAGIGKSRLVAALQAEARSRGFSVLQGSCFQRDLAFPYAPLLDLVRSSVAHQPFEVREATLEPFAQEFFPVLPDLIAPPPARASLPPLGPQQEQRRLFVALTAFFTKLVASHPLLFVIEDIHWCDEGSLEFLQYFIRHSTSFPWLVLLTYRSDEVHTVLTNWLAQQDRERRAQEFSLARLTRNDVDAMLAAIFELHPATRSALLNTLYPLTEGNPFFVEEVLTSLRAAGGIFYAEGAWRSKALEHIRIPRSVQAAVQQRSARLSEAARELLTLAAVAGRHFDVDLLLSITQQSEEQLLPLLKELMAAQLVVEESGEHFAFRHALTRQAIYADLLVRERKALHRRIAQTMERLYGSSLDAHLADLAYHFYEAGAWEQAAAYGQRAGEQALRLYAPHAAVEQLTRALDAAQHGALPPSAGLYRLRGQAYEMLGDFEQARLDDETTLRLARLACDRHAEWQATLDLGFLWLQRDYTQTGTYYQQALELARHLDDPIILARTLNRLGNWHVNVEQPHEALRYHQEALTLFEQAQDQHGIAQTCDLLGMTTSIGGDLVQATAYCQQAIALFRELDDQQGLASSLTTLMLLGEGGAKVGGTMVPGPNSFAESLHFGELALQTARKIGLRSAEAYVLLALAQFLGPQGEYAQALEMAQASLALCEQIEHRQWLTGAHWQVGVLYLDLLALPEAQHHLEEALSLAHEIGSRNWIRTVLGFLASAHLLQQDQTSADSILAASLEPGAPMQTHGQRRVWMAHAELALARGDPGLALDITDRLIASAANLSGERVIPHLWKLRGEALAALQRAAEAETVLRAAQAGAQAQGLRPLLWRIAVALGKLYQTQAREVEAEQMFSAAQALIEELAAKVPDERLREHFLSEATAMLPLSRLLSPSRIAKQAYSGLTAREMDVLRLLAQGLTSAQIAEQLVIGLVTVNAHVRSIYSKLGVTSRAAATRYALEHHLL